MLGNCDPAVGQPSAKPDFIAHNVIPDEKLANTLQRAMSSSWWEEAKKNLSKADVAAAFQAFSKSGFPFDKQPQTDDEMRTTLVRLRVIVPMCEGCRANSSKQARSFKRCSRCHLVYYCDVACQRRDWSRHKRTCCNPDAPAHPGYRPLFGRVPPGDPADDLPGNTLVPCTASFSRNTATAEHLV